MPHSSVGLNLTATNVALFFLFGSACFHSLGRYFYMLYRLILGTLFPAYSSYKAVKNRDVREYSRWMMYWIVFSLFSCAEVFTDIFIGFWLPFYYEIKIFFVLWLMSPYGNGSKIMYLHLIHPQLTRYEQSIDAYIDTAKEWGIQSLGLMIKKATEAANKSLFYLLQSAQTLIFTHIHSPPLTEQQLQSQRLLTQSNPSNTSFLQQLIFNSGSPQRTNQSQPSTGLTPPGFPDEVDSPMHITPPMPPMMSQRWFSTETINIVDISETTATSYPIGLRARSESESNLLDVQQVEGKPPIQPKQSRKRTKTKTSKKEPSDKPMRRTRAASAKAKTRLKETLDEVNVPSSSED